MLIYSKTLMSTTMLNTIILRGPDDGYLYLNLDTYNQAYELYLKHGDALTLSNRLDGENNEKLRVSFAEKLPVPVNMFVPFLSYVTEELSEDNIEDIIGALHIITSTLRLPLITGMPRSVQACITFGHSIKNEYKLSWENFFTTFARNDAVCLNSAPIYNSSAPPKPAPVKETLPPVSDGMLYMDDMSDEDFDKQFESILAVQETKPAEEKKEEQPAVNSVESKFKRWDV